MTVSFHNVFVRLSYGADLCMILGLIRIKDIFLHKEDKINGVL